MLIKRDVDGKPQSFPNGEVPAIIGTFTYTAKRMGGAPSITATIYYPTPLDKQWTHAEYVEFQGERYYATSIPSSSKDNRSVLYKHDVTFTSRREILDNTLFFDAVSNKDEDTKGGDRYRTNQTRFRFGGDITEFVSRINSSMKYCEVPYSVVIDDGYATTDVKEVSFENQYLTEVLQLINTTYQLDYYWVGNVCHVGKLQYDLTDNPIEYGRNDALVSVSKGNSNARIVDMITGYGSSDNIPYYYPNDDEFGKADYISENINEPIAISLPQLQKNANIGTDYAKKYTLYKREGALKATIKIDGSFFGTMPSSKLVVADGMDFGRIAVIPILAKKGMKIYEPKITVSHHTLKSGVSIKSDVFSFYMDNETEGNYNGSYTFTNDRYAALVIWEKITIKSTIGDVAVDKSISYNYIGSVEIEYENQSKAFWLFDGGVIEYESSGISVNNIDNVTSAKSLVTFEKIPNADNTSFWWGFKETYDTSTEEAAAKITIKGRTWIFPSQNLMPSVYRESGGAERFYYAKNDTYSIPGATDKYTFKNIYKEGNPHQGSVEFSDIKPTINGVRNDVIQSDGLGQLFGEIADVAFDSNDSDVKNDDSEYIHSYFYIKLHKFSGSYGFDLFKHALASESAKINLIKSNGCPACSFDIQCVPSKDKSKMYNCVSTDGHGNLKSVRDDCNDYIFKNDEDAYKDTFNQDSTKTELWIAVKKDDSTLGIIMPNASGNFKPQKGDLFVITGINPPKVLVTAAEKRLDEALIKYMSENNEDKFNYSVKFSRIFLQENMAFANKLNENSKVAITYAGEKHEFFVTNYTVKVDDSALADVEIELSDTLDASSSELKKVIDAVKGDTVAQLQGLIGGSGGLNATIANRLYLSKQGDDAAQGLITFAKGLISDVLVKLKGGATFGTRGYKFDEKGNVVVDALSSLAFDEALERGFGVTKNSRGKYTLSVTDLMVWGKAVFNSLEIRKLYAVGGNVYLSGASSKIVRAVPVKKATAAASSTGGDASETWVVCAEGDADCEGWKCYTLNDDGTTATQNGWRKYDQAKCQTFDIEAGTHEGVSNTFYWRLVADVSTKNETITETRTEAYVDDDGVTKTREVTVDLYDGKKFGWVVLSKTDCESTTNDAPKAGDTIVLDGHRMFASGDAEGRDQYNDESRTNVMMLETTGAEDGTLPRIVALTGIVDYKHSEDDNHPYSNTVFILSPKKVVFVSSSFEWIGASGDPITLVNFRGNWAEGPYRYYDQVSHGNAIWTCIVEKGKTTTEEPSDTSKVWRKEISGGKGEKGDKGDPGTPGNGIDHVETRFFAWKSDTFGTGFDSDRVWEDGSTTMPADFSDDFPWLWQVTRTYYTNGTDVLGEAVCIGYKGKDAVTYGVQVSSTYEVFSDAKKHAGIKVAYTKTTGMTVSSYDNVQVLGTAKVYADGTEINSASDHLNNGYNRIIFDYYTFDGTNNTASIGTASVITVELLVGDTVVATANFSNGKQGDGVVMAYKHADTQPNVPTGTDPENPGDGWSLSPDAATAGEKVTDVRYGGYESGTYDGNNKGTDATAKEWAEAEDDGRTWMKSPSGLSDYGYAMMKVSFTTQYDNTTVDVEIKAYSEQNFDLVEVWALDTAPSTGTSFRGQGLAQASGNGVEQAYSFTVAKAGRHFICVTYAKDISGDDNGDYGLFRLDLSDIEVAVSDTVWMSQAKVSGGKCVLPWSTPVKINGADGKDALEIVCYPETIVLDTDDNGLVNDTSNAWAALMCVRDGKVVDNVTYNIGEHDTVNCDATVNNNGIVTITSVTSQTVAIDGSTVTVSSTSGSVTVSVTENATGVTYTKTVPFTVNVARYTGGLKADNKKFESAYNYLTNNGNSTDFSYYESKIRQTAKEISLKVSEKSVGRRNLLVGSAFQRDDNNRIISNDARVEINSGYQGTNCIHVIDATEAGKPHYVGAYWDGSKGGRSIKIEKGKKYTMSCFCKINDINAEFYLEAIYTDKQENATIKGQAKYLSPHEHTVKKVNEWELFTTVIDTTGAEYDYIAFNFWEACIVAAGQIEAWICRPMVEEGDTYNGWTLSEQDYDYVGGNLLDGTGTLTKTGNVEVLDETTVKQGGYNNESASVKAILSPTAANNDFLEYSTAKMGLKAGDDCMLSFYARAASGYAHGGLQCYLHYPSTGNVITESSHEKIDGLWNPSDGHLMTPIAPTTEWKRYWVHWRPMGNVPQHVLFRLQRPGMNKGSYNSSTSYNVGDVVLYGGTYYVCRKSGSGYTPGASGSSSYWEASWFAIEIAQPKLEVGATMTEWTAKRSDMVDKQALYATGIDIDSKEITMTARNTKFRDNDGKELAVIDSDGLRATKIATTDTGQGHTVIDGNSTVWFQEDGVTPGIAVYYDAAGIPHLAFYGTDGKQKYDIGPSGLQSLISSIQQAQSIVAYLRDATRYVHTNNSTLTGFEWLYVASGEARDMRYVYCKQIPTTDTSAPSDIYNGCVFNKKYEGTNWPSNDPGVSGNLLVNGWYVKPNDGNLPTKLHMADAEGVFDPTKTLYYQTFYYYEGGKVARTVRAHMKRTTNSHLLSKFEYAGSYDEI